MQPIYTVETLTTDHNRRSFSCGIEALDKYFYYQASQDVKNHVAAVFVLAEEKQKIIGYYTLSAIAIDASELPPHLLKELPKYKLLPATLVGRMAIDKQYQKKGFGGMLIIDALRRGKNSSREIASMAMIVDAKNKIAVAFYEKYGFIRFVQQNKKLYLPINTAINNLFK